MRIIRRHSVHALVILLPLLMSVATGCSRTISTYGGDKQSEYGKDRGAQGREASRGRPGQPSTGGGEVGQEGRHDSPIPSLSQVQRPDAFSLGKSTGEERIPSDAIVTAPPVGGANGVQGSEGRTRSSRGLSGKSGTLLTGDHEVEIEAVNDVFFGFDSAIITNEGKQALLNDVRWFQTHPEVRLLIEGHCDERGTNAYNLVLGEKRSKAIRAFLTDQRIDHTRMSIVSYGKERPFCESHDESCYQQNRRVHFAMRE